MENVDYGNSILIFCTRYQGLALQQELYLVRNTKHLGHSTRWHYCNWKSDTVPINFNTRLPRIPGRRHIVRESLLYVTNQFHAQDIMRHTRTHSSGTDPRPFALTQWEKVWTDFSSKNSDGITEFPTKKFFGTAADVRVFRGESVWRAEYKLLVERRFHHLSNIHVVLSMSWVGA